MKKLENYLHTQKLKNPTWDWLKIEKNLKLAYPLIQPKEKILNFFLVSHKGKEWLLVMTDNRIMIARKGLFGKQIREVHLSKLDKVEKFHKDNDNFMEAHFENKIVKVSYMKSKFEPSVNELIKAVKAWKK